jgi:hypothetical protein
MKRTELKMELELRGAIVQESRFPFVPILVLRRFVSPYSVFPGHVPFYCCIMHVDNINAQGTLVGPFPCVTPLVPLYLYCHFPERLMYYPKTLFKISEKFT